jgi:hypothetical protein
MRPFFFLLSVALGLALVLIGGTFGALTTSSASAEDETPVAVTALERVNLSAWSAAPAPGGPVLAAPSDLLSGSSDYGTTWTVPTWSERGSPRPVWIEFDQESETALPFTPDALVEALRARGLGDDRVELHADSRELVIRGPAAAVAAVRKNVDWALALLAPSARLKAGLTSEGRDAGVRAQGQVRLWPGRWSRLWLQEQRVAHVVDWDVEIAQETTSMNPVEMPLPEGQEAYVRWFPGETLSLLEVWSGDLEPQDPTEIDLSAARNVPEGNGPGTVRLPRTAVLRAYTALLFPPAGGAGQDIVWQGPAGTRRLRVALEGVSPPLAPAAGLGRDGQIGPLRTGAVAAGLLFESRNSAMDRLMDELGWIQNSAGLEGNVQSHGRAQSLALVEGPAKLFQALGDHVRRQEAALRSAMLRVRVLTVPEESVRATLAQGALSVGEPLPAGLLERLRTAGAVEGEAITLPVAAGVKAGFRVGASIAGLTGFDVEVAQQAGAVDPISGALFAGLAGEATLASGPQGMSMAVEATVSWGDPKASTITMTFRPPVGMSFNKEKSGSEPGPQETRHPVFPLLGGGSGEVHASFPVAAKDAGERLLGLVLRGNEALLVLGSATSP